MWLSCLRLRAYVVANARLGFALGIAMNGTLAGRLAVAAEIYVQPQGELQAEVDSNRRFASAGNKTTGEGYAGTVGLIWGVATPLSDTIIRPQIGYVDFPKDSEKAVQGSVDLASSYHSQRSNVSIFGTFNRSDTYNSELASAVFNPIVPVSPTTPETGLITTNTVRTLARIEPSYAYKLSQRLGIGVSGLYENADYRGDFANQYFSYDYSVGSVFVEWAATPRTDIRFSPFVSRDAAKRGGPLTNASGGNVAIEHKWSNTFSGRLELTGERDDISQPPVTKGTLRSDHFGATYTSVWHGQISSVQLSAGRTFTPSGAGGKYRADQAQLEYDRKASARLSTTFAIRYIRSDPLAQFQGGAYKYLETVAGLKWLATRTWYFTGGVKYQWLHYGAATDAAHNNMAYVGIGYEGLGKRPQ
jgi:hypothetical protein